MKKLSNETMLSIDGGSFWGGFCGAIASVGTAALLAGAVTGVGVFAFGAADIGCGFREIFFLIKSGREAFSSLLFSIF